VNLGVEATAAMEHDRRPAAYDFALVQLDNILRRARSRARQLVQPSILAEKVIHFDIRYACP
jgi:hypothetical protein